MSIQHHPDQLDFFESLDESVLPSFQSSNSEILEMISRDIVNLSSRLISNQNPLVCLFLYDLGHLYSLRLVNELYSIFGNIAFSNSNVAFFDVSKFSSHDLFRIVSKLQQYAKGLK